MRKKVHNELKRLSDGFKHLNDRVTVLEFKEKAKGNTYIITPLSNADAVWVDFLNEYQTEKKFTTFFLDGYTLGSCTQNGKYLVIKDFGVVKEVYTVSGDRLVKVDVNLYKAWLEAEKDRKKVSKLIHENSEKILNTLKDGSKGVCYINPSKSNEEMIKEIKEEKVIDKSFADSLSSVFDSFNKCTDVLEAAVKAAEAKPSNKIDIYEVETPDCEKAYAVVEDSGEVKQTKKNGDLTCDDIEGCENCPMQLINCTRNCRDTDIPFTEMLKKVLSNPDTGEIEDPELYNLFKARLDKEVKE